MSSEDGVRPLTCFSVSLLMGQPQSQNPVNWSLHQPKSLSPPPIFLGGGSHNNLISLCEEILNEMLQESILRLLIFSFMGKTFFVSFSSCCQYCATSFPSLWSHLGVQYNNQIKPFQGTAFSFIVQKRTIQQAFPGCKI